MSTVSVVIITYQRQDYLAEAVRSVLAQSVPPYEIIIVNSGNAFPPDFTRSLEAVGTPLRIVATENDGPARARNEGAAVASGDVLAFLDDDDLWESDYLAAALARMQAENAPCAVTWFDNLEEGRRTPGKYIPRGVAAADLWLRNPGITGSNLVVERAAFAALGGFDGALWVSEDKDFLIRALQRGRVAVVERPLVLHRLHGRGNLSTFTRPRPQQIAGKKLFLEKYHAALRPADIRVLQRQIEFLEFLAQAPGGRKTGTFLKMAWQQPLPLLRHMKERLCR